MVNSRRSETGSGVFRLLDTDDDDKFDKVVVVRRLESVGGEHGPHAIVPTPDGKSLMVLMGNQTRLPPDFTHSRVPELWGEDQLLPPMEHFMKGARAPVGHVARMDPEGRSWEVIATGFRNQYDGAFNREGEFFIYDADMEGDLNTPWYRPTRINHVISGADFGWRTGSAKFADHYRDSFGAVVDIGLGSPTGVCFGYGASFPPSYRDALFICDWSYGKMYAVHLEEKGSTYGGSFEEFVSGIPLPLTDVLIHPKDGAMYFIVGGRRVQSGLYRITYRGDLGVEEEGQADPAGTLRGLREKRLVLESFLLEDARRLSREELAELWSNLGRNDDRAMRHAARAVLEKHPVGLWRGLVLEEENCNRAGLGLIALARAGAPASAGEVMEKVIGFDYEAIEEKQDRLNLLRALTLALTRGGGPSSGGPPPGSRLAGQDLSRGLGEGKPGPDGLARKAGKPFLCGEGHETSRELHEPGGADHLCDEPAFHEGRLESAPAPSIFSLACEVGPLSWGSSVQGLPFRHPQGCDCFHPGQRANPGVEQAVSGARGEGPSPVQ